MLKLIRKVKKIYIVIGCLLLVALIGFVDFKTGENIDFSVLYFLPIVIAAWFLRQEINIGIVIVSTSIWLYSEWSIGTRYQETHSLFINGLLLLISDLFLVALISRLKKEIQLSAERKILYEKEKLIIKTSQSICGLIGQYVSFHNSEIINWINTRKNSGHQVSEKVEKSSQAIGKGVGVLTSMSFGSIYGVGKTLHEDKFLLDLNDQLKSIEKNISSKN